MKPCSNIFLSLLLLLLAQSAHASNSESGVVDKLWSNPDNWVGEVVPNGNTVDAAFVGATNVAIDGGAHTLTSTGYLTAGTLEVPAVESILDPSPKVSCLSTVGQSYQLQKSTDMSPESWTDVVGQSVDGDGSEKILSDSTGGPPGETKTFYRVETN